MSEPQDYEATEAWVGYVMAPYSEHNRQQPIRRPLVGEELQFMWEKYGISPLDPSTVPDKKTLADLGRTAIGYPIVFVSKDKRFYYLDDHNPWGKWDYWTILRIGEHVEAKGKMKKYEGRFSMPLRDVTKKFLWHVVDPYGGWHDLDANAGPFMPFMGRDYFIKQLKEDYPNAEAVFVDFHR
jgi:hypothetical protein